MTRPARPLSWTAGFVLAQTICEDLQPPLDRLAPQLREAAAAENAAFLTSSPRARRAWIRSIGKRVRPERPSASFYSALPPRMRALLAGDLSRAVELLRPDVATTPRRGFRPPQGLRDAIRHVCNEVDG